MHMHMHSVCAFVCIQTCVLMHVARYLGRKVNCYKMLVQLKITFTLDNLYSGSTGLSNL